MRQDLKSFFTEFGRLASLVGDARQEKFEMPLKNFEEHWLDRIAHSERAELRGGRITADAAVRDRDRDGKQQNTAKDFEAFKQLGLSPVELNTMYNAVDRSSEPSTVFSNDRQKLADAIYERGRELIQDNHDLLRERLHEAVQELRRGQQPSLIQEHERNPKSLEEYRSQASTIIAPPDFHRERGLEMER